jgi:hypothetical protein
MHQTSHEKWKIDFALIRQRVSIADVLGLLDWEANKTHGHQLRGPCPIHQSRPQSVIFAVNLEKNAWYCHSSKCQSGGNQLDLFAAATSQSLYPGTVDLCQRLGINPHAKT